MLTFIYLLIGISGHSQTINESESMVTFEVSNMKFNNVEGTIKGMNGDLTFDSDNLEICSFDVCMDPATISTGNAKRDEHLQQEEYFHTERYSQICFVSKETRNTEGGGYAVIGSMTIRDVTQDVMIPFTFDGSTFKGRLTINRKDYNIGKEVGTFMIGESVDVAISCSLAK